MFKMRWLPDSQQNERKRIYNLCINALESAERNVDIGNTSSPSDTEEDFLIFSPNQSEKNSNQLKN